MEKSKKLIAGLALSVAAITTGGAITAAKETIDKITKENKALRVQVDSYRKKFNTDCIKVLEEKNSNTGNKKEIGNEEKVIEKFWSSEFKPAAVLKEFETKISSGTYIVEFTGPFCPPCEKMKPFIAASANSYAQHGIKTLEVFNNGDEREAIKNKYGVTAYPTIIIFKDGKEIGRIVGVEPEKLNERLKSILGSSEEAPPRP